MQPEPGGSCQAGGQTGPDELTIEHLRALVEATSDWIWEVDENGVYTFSNGKIRDLLGYEPREVLGKTPFDFMVPEEVTRITRIFADTAQAHQPFTCLENVNIHKDGRRVVLETSAVPLFREDGTFCGYRGIDRDITGRKEVEAALEDARQQAEQANRAKDTFLAVLSHELRTPLAPILNVVNLLEETAALPEEARDYVNLVRRNVEMEARLVDDLLDLSRITRGKTELKLVALDAHEHLCHVVQMCRPEIQQKSLSLSINAEAQQSWIRGDITRFHQIVWNILRNAVKFTPSGGHITIATSNPTVSDLAITITDSGVGIDPEILPRVFNAFEQGGSDTTRQFGGLGLGLAITKAMVELHGGSVVARSDGKGKGATFTVALPTVDPPAAGEVNLPHATASRAAARVLLVDDHADTLRILSRLLTLHGYSVRTASSVFEALQLAREEPFDLLISDIGLPDGSGVELMRQLRSLRPIRGIALSGFGMESDVQASLGCGYSSHLTKPLDFAVLLENIESTMSAGLPA